MEYNVIEYYFLSREVMFKKFFNNDKGPFGELKMDENQFTEDIKETTETAEEQVEEKPEEQAEEDAAEAVEEQVEEKQEDELEKLKNEHETLKNQYVRLAADFDNYRKRQAQERESLLKYGTVECLTKMVEVIDNFERAMKSIDKIDNIEKMKENFSILNKQFMDSLTKMGLEVISAEGQTFDPNIHEAVMQTPTSEYPEETIIAELQKGYKYGDKVLRPARVNVAVSE